MDSLTGMIHEVTKWIEPGVIAESIFELDGVNTVDQAKKVSTTDG